MSCRLVEAGLSEDNAIDLVAVTRSHQIIDKSFVRRLIHRAEIDLNEEQHRAQSRQQALPVVESAHARAEVFKSDGFVPVRLVLVRCDLAKLTDSCLVSTLE